MHGRSSSRLFERRSRQLGKRKKANGTAGRKMRVSSSERHSICTVDLCIQVCVRLVYTVLTWMLVGWSNAVTCMVAGLVPGCSTQLTMPLKYNVPLIALTSYRNPTQGYPTTQDYGEKTEGISYRFSSEPLKHAI